MRFHCKMLVVCTVFWGGSMVLAAEKPVKEQSYEERYKLLWEQNMFLKDRRLREQTTRRAFTSDTGSRTEDRTREQMFARRGVALEEGADRAYCEDAANGSMLRLNVVEPLPRGHSATE